MVAGSTGTREPRATAIIGGETTPLMAGTVTLPAASVVIDIDGLADENVLLDGRLLPSREHRVVAAVDLTRSTGFHRLQVGTQTIWFATEDAKLRLEGIEQMLAILRTTGTGWSGQIMFSNGELLRDTHVVYAWLDQCADAAFDAVRRIVDAPRSVRRTDRMPSRRGGKSLHKTATIRMLRARPRHLLEERPEGLFVVGDKAYDPLRVVVRTHTTSVRSLANQRAASLVARLDRLAAEVLAADPDVHVGERCRSWRATAAELSRRALVRAMSADPSLSALVAPRQTEEMIDSRYRESYRISTDLHARFGWKPTQQPLPRFSYVERADQIYQAFVASALADALGLTQTAPVLGQSPLAFAGNDFEIYYDSHPDPAILRSWRYSSAKPDASRPDVLLRQRSSGKVLVIDAKYRVDGTQATEDSRKDVAAYMALYGLDAVVIAFPGPAPARCTTVTGQGKMILELPVGPWPGLTRDLTAELPRLLAEMRTPTY